ncbi:unnamed protein product, partial [Closterium sp. NIES-54]
MDQQPPDRRCFNQNVRSPGCSECAAAEAGSGSSSGSTLVASVVTPLASDSLIVPSSAVISPPARERLERRSSEKGKAEAETEVEAEAEARRLLLARSDNVEIVIDAQDSSSDGANGALGQRSDGVRSSGCFGVTTTSTSAVWSSARLTHCFVNNSHATSSSDSRFGSSTSNDSTASSSSSGSGGSSSNSSPGRADDDVSSGRGEHALGPELADGGTAQSAEDAGGRGSTEERLRGRASAQRMWFGARAARGARRGAQIAEGAEREAQGRSRSRTSGAMRRAAAESANAHEGDDEGERGNGRTNGGAEQGGSESNYQRPLSVVIHGPVSSFFVGTQVVYNGDGGQRRDAGNGEHSKSKSPVKELKEKHKIDADTGACNGDTGASPEFIILEKSCSVFGHAEAHNGAATNAYYDPAEGSHAMGGEESDGSCSSNCSSDCSDDSSCSRERGKGGGHREKRGGGGGGDSGDLIDFQFVSASGESEGSTWIEAVHLVLPPVIPRSSSEATWDALQAPNGTAGMEPILDCKWEAGFKGTKRAFACLLLLGCLLYIAAFL